MTVIKILGNNEKAQRQLEQMIANRKIDGAGLYDTGLRVAEKYGVMTEDEIRKRFQYRHESDPNNNDPSIIDNSRLTVISTFNKKELRERVLIFFSGAGKVYEADYDAIGGAGVRRYIPGDWEKVLKSIEPSLFDELNAREKYIKSLSRTEKKAFMNQIEEKSKIDKTCAEMNQRAEKYGIRIRP